MRKSVRLSPDGPEVFELECGSGSSFHPLPRRDETLPEIYEITENLPGIHEIAAEMYEMAEDETSPEIHDIADSGFERAANFLLTLSTERDGEARKVERNPTSDRDGNPSSDMVHSGGNLQRLESLANTGNGGYHCIFWRKSPETGKSR